MTAGEWAAGWERFLNLGEGECQITDLVEAMGRRRLARRLAGAGSLAEDPGAQEWARWWGRAEALRSGGPEASGVWSFGLGICRCPRESGLLLDAELVDRVAPGSGTTGSSLHREPSATAPSRS